MKASLLYFKERLYLFSIRSRQNMIKSGRGGNGGGGGEGEKKGRRKL